MEKNKYKLPDIAYGYKDLEPYISEELLKLHHQKHHQAYINGANAILDKLEKDRSENAEADIKSLLKELSFNIGGHILHSAFWANIGPKKNEDNRPKGELLQILEDEFGSFERFKKEFSQAAVSAEGSGWAVLNFCQKLNRPLISQIEKHNINVYPSFKILLVLDVWEHAYYLDYKNDRAKFVENFWNIVNWEEAAKRLK